MRLLIEKNAIKLGVGEATGFAGLETQLKARNAVFLDYPGMRNGVKIQE
jgi:hypothetical protein